MLIQRNIPFYPSDDCFVSLSLALNYRGSDSELPNVNINILRGRKILSIFNKHGKPTKKREPTKISDSG